MCGPPTSGSAYAGRLKRGLHCRSQERIDNTRLASTPDGWSETRRELRCHTIAKCNGTDVARAKPWASARPSQVLERLINAGASAAQPRVLVFTTNGNKSGPPFVKFSYPRTGYNGRSWSIKDAGCVRIGSYCGHCGPLARTGTSRHGPGRSILPGFQEVCR